MSHLTLPIQKDLKRLVWRRQRTGRSICDMRVLVTGASGFVGSYVTTFCPAHYQVHPLSRKSILNGTVADLITHTVEDFVALFSHQAIEGIIHLAAEANISNCEHVQEAHALNVRVTERLVSAARQTGLPILLRQPIRPFRGRRTSF